ncbi:MAG: endonuclease/exonuclease/phosphatase family protein [Bacteroidales bacterium]|nr:endonuclease/exonuclease/phosphatase family protein [Bacteroidales bacterium]
MSLIVLLIGWNTYEKYFQFGGKENEITGDKIKITSYNVRVFNFCDSYEEQQLLKNFYKFINKVSPDILCLQEFYSDKNITVPPELNISQSMNADFSAFSKYYLFQTQRNYSIATFSKYPVLNEGTLRFNDKTKAFCLFTDILIDNDTIRIYNVHLESIQLSEDDYSFVSEIASTTDKKNLKEKSAKIFYKLKYAFKSRARQADVIYEHIQKCPYPLVVCGDFNDTPSSYSYNVITENLKDSFIEGGKGYGKTYDGNLPAFLRIDYVLHDDNFISCDFETSWIELSDHYPVTTDLILNK